jgi:membrane associated rhomboid family serine protease
MHPAAVGFQCPSCVSDGNRSTRTGRTAYGGKRSSNPALTSQVLIALNVAVFVFLATTGSERSEWFYRLALLPAGGTAIIDGQPQVFPGVADGSYWQLLTSAFTHLGIFHISFNMLALWVLGPQLELVLGRVRFLAVYFLSAFSASATVYWLTATNVPTIGASGAVYGLMGALFVVARKVGGDVSQLLLWIGLNFVITFLAPFISWQGHLGGFVGGLLVATMFVYAPKASRSRWQLACAVTFAVLIAVAIATRSLVLA